MGNVIEELEYVSTTMRVRTVFTKADMSAGTVTVEHCRTGTWMPSAGVLGGVQRWEFVGAEQLARVLEFARRRAVDENAVFGD